MMKIGKILMASAVMVMSGAGMSFAQQTKLLTADKHNEYGLVYMLPVTSLRIEVTAKETVTEAGPYYQYAKKYIGTDRVIKEDSQNWEIIGVKAERYGSANPDLEYLMQLKPGALTYLCVADDGMLLSINKEVYMPELEEVATSSGYTESVGVRDYLQYVNEDFMASQSTAKQAQMLAESLMEVREARLSLTRGTADAMPTDGRQLELMLASLDNQEQAYMAAFTGTTKSRTVVREYDYTPGDEGREILFRMSPFAGFCESEDLSGDPVYIEVKSIAEGSLPVDDKGVEKRIPKDAVIYTIPGSAEVRMSLNGKKLWNSKDQYAQYGVQFGVAPTLFSDKRERSYAVYDAATGALKEIGVVNE